VTTLSMRRSFPAGVHRAGASRMCHPGRYAALPSPDPIHNFRSYLAPPRPPSMCSTPHGVAALSRALGVGHPGRPVGTRWVAADSHPVWCSPTNRVPREGFGRTCGKRVDDLTA
jgi:hypothetical protein